jgi:hypothetical protein
MTFAVQIRLLVGNPKVTEGRRAVCVGCEWYQAATRRCMEPKCGVCPASALRMDPWISLPRCPGGRWAV